MDGRKTGELPVTCGQTRGHGQEPATEEDENRPASTMECEAAEARETETSKMEDEFPETVPPGRDVIKPQT